MRQFLCFAYKLRKHRISTLQTYIGVSGSKQQVPSQVERRRKERQSLEERGTVASKVVGRLSVLPVEVAHTPNT